MANPTTNYGFVLPTPTDLVTDLPADFDVALQGVDTRLKALQPGTTLGDLAYASATANTNTRLALGTAGQVLTVNSGATAPEWATSSSGGMTLISTTSLSGSSVSLTSIPQTYNNLVLVIRNYKPSTDGDSLWIRFNSVTGNDYNGQGTNSTGSPSFDRDYGEVLANIDNTAADGLAYVEIFDYSNTATWKYARSWAFSNNNTTPTSISQRASTIWTNKSAAISSIQITGFYASITSGTALLYGVK